MQSNTMDTGQITRLFGTELLSSEECGVYITNIEIYKIAKELGLDITLTSNEFIIGEIFKVCSKENRLDELHEKILRIFSSRLAEYKKIKETYPKASLPVDLWIARAQKTFNKLQNTTMEKK